MGNRETFSVGRPVGGGDVLEDFPGRPAGQRRLRKSSPLQGGAERELAGAKRRGRPPKRSPPTGGPGAWRGRERDRPSRCTGLGPPWRGTARRSSAAAPESPLALVQSSQARPG